MKPLNILVIALASLGLLALGGTALGLALDSQGLQRLRELLQGALGLLDILPAARLALGAAGALALALGLGLAWGNLASRRFERIVVLRNPLGDVMVSLAALEDLGRLVKGEVAGVKDLKLQLSANRRGLRASARVVLQGDVDLNAVTEAVQAAIRRRLQEVVGADQDIRPRVMVSRVALRESESEEPLLKGPRLRRPPRP